MTRLLAPAALAVIVALSLLVAAQSDGPVTDAARVERLTEQLRCPVCDGLAVADSPSSTARAIAADVRARVAAGETDQDIRHAYVAQYGEWILLEPPAGGFGMLAWAVPTGGAAAAAAVAAWVLRRRATTTVRPDPAARAAVTRALSVQEPR